LPLILKNNSMIKRLFEKLKALHLYFVNNDKVPTGCATCEYRHYLMSDKPCLNCTGHYSEYKQKL